MAVSRMWLLAAVIVSFVSLVRPEPLLTEEQLRTLEESRTTIEQLTNQLRGQVKENGPSYLTSTERSELIIQLDAKQNAILQEKYSLVNFLWKPTVTYPQDFVGVCEGEYKGFVAYILVNDILHGVLNNVLIHECQRNKEASCFTTSIQCSCCEATITVPTLVIDIASCLGSSGCIVNYHSLKTPTCTCCYCKD